MGGFIATAYALKYPLHVRRLSLLSPIGLNGFNASLLPTQSALTRFVIKTLWNITPQRLLRVLRPERTLNMLKGSRRGLRDAFPYKGDEILEYVVLLNRAKRVSGAVAFTKLLDPSKGWMKPLGEELVKSNVPVDIMYGSGDWMCAIWATEQIGIDLS
jgi:pimeloyl-ACP methyl ester carboxylesterase